MAALTKDPDVAPGIDFSEYEGDDEEQAEAVVPPGWEAEHVVQLEPNIGDPWVNGPAMNAAMQDGMSGIDSAGLTNTGRMLQASVPKMHVVFPRALHRGMTGWDVRGHKRALSRAFPDLYPWPKEGVGFTDYFGEYLEKALRKAQARLHIQATGKLGLKTHIALEQARRDGHPHEFAFDDMAIQLCHEFAVSYAKTPDQRVREAIVAAWSFWVTVNSQISYEQERPFGLYKPPAFERRMDCSEMYSVGCFAGGSRDPNGMGWNGFGYTGTIMAHTTRCDITELEEGDAIFFGSSSGRRGFNHGDPTHIAGYGGIQFAPEVGRKVRVVYTMGSSKDPRMRPIDYRHDVHHYAKLHTGA